VNASGAALMYDPFSLLVPHFEPYSINSLLKFVQFVLDRHVNSPEGKTKVHLAYLYV